MSLNKLIRDYNSTHKVELGNRQTFLSGLSEKDFWRSIRDFGRVEFAGKSKPLSHFKNNRWYNSNQTTIDSKKVQLRYVLIEEIIKKNILYDTDIKTFKQIF